MLKKRLFLCFIFLMSRPTIVLAGSNDVTIPATTVAPASYSATYKSSYTAWSGQKKFRTDNKDDAGHVIDNITYFDPFLDLRTVNNNLGPGHPLIPTGVVPSEILVYVNATQGSYGPVCPGLSKCIDLIYTIYTKEPEAEGQRYNQYFFRRLYKNGDETFPAVWMTNNSSFWLPCTSDMKLYVHYTAGAFDYSTVPPTYVYYDDVTAYSAGETDLYVIGYR